MNSSTRTLLLFALGLVVLGGGLFALLETTDGGRAPGENPRPVMVEPSVAPQEAPVEELSAPADRVGIGELLHTTVLWPLRVELELLEADYLPAEPGIVPIGSGANAQLKGHVHGRDEDGLRAKVRFVAGPNLGRVLTTDGGGRFGATDLFPGLSIIEVEGPGLNGGRREVRLRQGKETELNLTYGAPGQMIGRVQNDKGEPIENASVTVDGIPTTTGPEGEFFVGQVAAGQVLVEIEHPDFARYQELVWVTSARMTPRGSLEFTLRKGAVLRVAVTTNVGGPGPVQLLFLPGQANRRPSQEAYRNARFPYHSINPVEIWPGSPKEIRGLPAEVVQVFAFRPGAESKQAVVNLRPGQPYDLSIQLKPAPTLRGVVTLDGEPVEGADVSLEAPDEVRATLSFLRKGSFFLETAVMPVFPSAHQEVRTDEKGRFVLTTWEDVTATRYLEARSPDGKAWAGRLVRRGDRQVDLELSEARFGTSSLMLDFPGRWQGLPLEVVMDGQPLDPRILPPNEDLLLPELMTGRYRLRLSWHGREIAEETVDVERDERRRYDLIAECIEGQEEEDWVRAGREWPGTLLR